METPLGTVESGACRAEIYETALPGQFTVKYFDAKNSLVGEEDLTGVSTYKQREDEIRDRIHELCEGKTPEAGDLSDSGEY